MEIFDTYYSPNDVYQTLFFGGAGALGLLFAWYVFIRAPQQRLTEMAPWAAKRGLRFTPPGQSMGAHTIGEEVSVLEGVIQGVPFVLRSVYLANARRAGINGRTEIQCRAGMPAAVAFQAEFQPGPSVQGADAVWTGDPMFDAQVRTRSDNAGAVRAWLQPALKAALVQAVRDGTITVIYQGGEISLRMSKPIWEEPILDRILPVIPAAAQSRLG